MKFCGYLGEETNHLRNYIDWERVASDLRFDLNTFDGEDGLVYVFWAH